MAFFPVLTLLNAELPDNHYPLIVIVIWDDNQKNHRPQSTSWLTENPIGDEKSDISLRLENLAEILDTQKGIPLPFYWKYFISPLHKWLCIFKQIL